MMNQSHDLIGRSLHFSFFFFTYSSQHDANNEPSESPDGDVGGRTAAGDLRQCPHGTQEDSQKASLQQLTLPTWANHRDMIYLQTKQNKTHKQNNNMQTGEQTCLTKPTKTFSLLSAPEALRDSFNFGYIRVVHISNRTILRVDRITLQQAEMSGPLSNDHI